MMKNSKIKILDIIPFIILIALVVIFAILSRGVMLTGYNLQNVVIQVVPVIIASLGVAFVVSLGGTDISIGASAAVGATLGAIVANSTGQSWTIFPITLLFTVGVGALVGVIVTKCKVGSFMTTLAILISARGVLNFLLSRETIYVPEGLGFMTSLGVCVVLLVAIIAVVFFVFEKSKFGYYCKCIGENERTVKSVGINVSRIRITCFIISGLLAGIVGIITLCRIGGSTNTLCNMMEMRVQMAIFLGGILTTGGFSTKIYKVIIGSITIVVIENGLTLCGASSALSEAVEGILLVIILCTTIYCNNVSEKKSIKLSTHDVSEVVE